MSKRFSGQGAIAAIGLTPVLAALLLVSPLAETSLQAAVINSSGTHPFTGAEAGQGLTLTTPAGGQFIYALNFADTAADGSLPVSGSATFVPETPSTPAGNGVTLSGVSAGIDHYGFSGRPQYNEPGGSTYDQNLELVSWDIIYGNDFTVSLAVQPDTTYNLQLLFSENSYTSAGPFHRIEDVAVDSQSVETDYDLVAASGNSPHTAGSVVYANLTTGASQTSLPIEISFPADGTSFDDTNLVLNGLTLATVPEPASLSILLLGSVGLLARRPRARRK